MNQILAELQRLPRTAIEGARNHHGWDLAIAHLYRQFPTDVGKLWKDIAKGDRLPQGGR